MTTETNAERLADIKRIRAEHLAEEYGTAAIATTELKFLVQQAERAQELERLLGVAKDGAYWDELQLTHWKAESARLRKALEIIANSDSWLMCPEPSFTVEEAYDQCVKEATKALKGESG